MRKNVLSAVFVLLMMFVALAGCSHEAALPEQTSASETVPAAETVLQVPAKADIELKPVASATAPEENAVIDAQTKLNVVKQFTVDYEGDELTFYEGSAFLDLYIAAYMHWNPQPLVRDWEKLYPVYDLTMEYEDPVYGKIDLSCKGIEAHEVLMSDIFFMYYDTCTFKEKDGTEHYYKREKIEEQKFYILGSCEGEYFGMPLDGGTGPFWLVEMGDDGKVRPLFTEIVMMKASLPSDLVLPGSL